VLFARRVWSTGETPVPRPVSRAARTVTRFVPSVWSKQKFPPENRGLLVQNVLKILGN